MQRSWSEFFGRFALPKADWAGYERRVAANLWFWHSNYVWLSLAVSAWVLLRTPSLLLVLALSVMLWSYVLGVRKAPIVISGKPLTDTQKVGGCAALSLLLLLGSGNLVSLLFILALSTALVLLHASLRPANTKAKVSKFMASVRMNFGGSSSSSSSGGSSSGGLGGGAGGEFGGMLGGGIGGGMGGMGGGGFQDVGLSPAREEYPGFPRGAGAGMGGSSSGASAGGGGGEDEEDEEGGADVDPEAGYSASGYAGSAATASASASAAAAAAGGNSNSGSGSGTGDPWQSGGLRARGSAGVPTMYGSSGMGGGMGGMGGGFAGHGMGGGGGGGGGGGIYGGGMGVVDPATLPRPLTGAAKTRTN